MPRYLTSLDEVEKIFKLIKESAEKLQVYLTSDLGKDLNLNVFSKITKRKAAPKEPFIIYACRVNRDSAKVLLDNTKLNLSLTGPNGETALLATITSSPNDISRSLVELLLNKLAEQNILINQQEFAAIKDRIKSNVCTKKEQEIFEKMQQHNTTLENKTSKNLLFSNPIETSNDKPKLNLERLHSALILNRQILLHGGCLSPEFYASATEIVTVYEELKELSNKSTLYEIHEQYAKLLKDDFMFVLFDFYRAWIYFTDKVTEKSAIIDEVDNLLRNTWRPTVMGVEKEPVIKKVRFVI